MENIWSEVTLNTEMIAYRSHYCPEKNAWVDALRDIMSRWIPTAPEEFTRPGKYPRRTRQIYYGTRNGARGPPVGVRLHPNRPTKNRRGIQTQNGPSFADQEEPATSTARYPSSNLYQSDEESDEFPDNFLKIPESVQVAIDRSRKITHLEQTALEKTLTPHGTRSPEKGVKRHNTKIWENSPRYKRIPQTPDGI